MSIEFVKSKIYKNRHMIVINKNGTLLSVYLTSFEVKELSRLMKEKGF